jgi:hypothetical protein
VISTHDEIAEVLGAYALDAVDADEAAAVEDHLASCPRCRDEVAKHREVAASLAYAGANAPDGLWDRIASGLDTGPSAPDLARLYPLKRASRSVSASVVGAVGALAAGLILVLALQVHAQGRDINHLQSALPGVGLETAARSALLDPSAVKVHLQSVNGSVYVDAVKLPDGTGYLVANDLPALAADRTYQLWGQVGDRNVSLGVLGPHPTIVPFRASAPIRALAVTDERSGGVAVSQQPTVAVGFLPAGQSPTTTA